MGAAITKLAKLGIGTADPVDTALQHAGFDVGVTRELRDTNANRGTFYKDGNRMAENRQVVQPTYTNEPTSQEIHPLLNWIMSGTPTGTTTKTYPLSNTATVRFVHFKPNQGEEWFLSGVAVDTCTMRAVSGEALTFDMGLVGQTYNDAHATLPALSYDLTTRPYLLSHLVLTVDGSARPCRSFALAFNFFIDKSRYLNSLTLTAINKLDTVITFSCEVPSGDNTGLWDNGLAGVAASAVFTNPASGKILTITLPDIRFPARAPNFPPGGEGFLTIEAEAMRVGQADTDHPVTISLTQ